MFLGYFLIILSSNKFIICSISIKNNQNIFQIVIILSKLFNYQFLNLKIIKNLYNFFVFVLIFIILELIKLK